MRDPVAVPAVLEGLTELRPGVPVTQLAELGHYPQIEEPATVAAAVGGALREPDLQREGHRDDRK
jgi:pimeloyl-ACP methyl ester carboxylesterase